MINGRFSRSAIIYSISWTGGASGVGGRCPQISHEEGRILEISLFPGGINGNLVVHIPIIIVSCLSGSLLL